MHKKKPPIHIEFDAADIAFLETIKQREVKRHAKEQQNPATHKESI